MADTKLQRAARIGLKMLLIWATMIGGLTWYDYIRQEPRTSAGGAYWAILWVAIFAVIITIHYLVVAAWPSRWRWIYFWVAAPLLILMTITRVESSSKARVIDPLTSSQFWSTMATLAFICLPLLYMRLRPNPKGKSAPPRRRS